MMHKKKKTLKYIRDKRTINLILAFAESSATGTRMKGRTSSV